MWKVNISKNTVRRRHKKNQAETLGIENIMVEIKSIIVGINSGMDRTSEQIREWKMQI